jgi:hypothetical protein
MPHCAISRVNWPPVDGFSKKLIVSKPMQYISTFYGPRNLTYRRFKTKAKRSFETSANDYPLTQRRILEEPNPQLHRCENFIIRNRSVHHRVHNSLVTITDNMKKSTFWTLLSLRCLLILFSYLCKGPRYMFSDYNFCISCTIFTFSYNIGRFHNIVVLMMMSNRVIIVRRFERSVLFLRLVDRGVLNK